MKKLVLIFITLFFSNSAWATFSCTVDVNAVLVYSNGAVNISHAGRNDYTFICNLKTERQGVSIATCATWASFLFDAKKNNRKVQFYYNSHENYNSCSELPTYSASPAPVYIGEV